MKYTSLIFSLLFSISLVACDKTPETSIMPLPENSLDAGGKNARELSGDDDIQLEPKQTEDHEIQSAPPKPDGDPKMTIPPPVLNIPPEITPEHPIKPKN